MKYDYELLNEREKTYGSFSDLSHITQTTKDFWKQQPGWAFLSFSQREALEYIATKIARILNCPRRVIAGEHKDTWDDIAGYALLISAQLREDPVRKVADPAGHKPQEPMERVAEHTALVNETVQTLVHGG